MFQPNGDVDIDVQPHSTRLYLSVDCGGTKAAAVISSASGQVISRGLGGPANFTDVGMTNFVRAVTNAVESALAALPAEYSPFSKAATAGRGRIRLPASSSLFEAVWFGIAGVDRAADIVALEPVLARLLTLPYPSPRLLVANDTSLLAAPVRDPSFPHIRSGVVVIAGTGSIVMSFKEGEDGSLRTLGRIGGFGWLLGDEGSGFCVGRDALRWVLDQADRERLEAEQDGWTEEQSSSSLGGGGAASQGRGGGEGKHMLRDRILEHWNLTSTDDLLFATYSVATPAPASAATTTANTSSQANGLVEVPAAASAPSANLLPPPAPAHIANRAPSPVPPLSPDPSRASTPSSSLSVSMESTAAETETETDSAPGAAGSSSAPIQALAAHMEQERKHRLASLAPLVFHLAFAHNDPASLLILRLQARALALQINEVLRPGVGARAHLDPGNSVLCMGGSLLSRGEYRNLLEEELARLGVGFGRAEFVHDAARGGASALAALWEQRRVEGKHDS